MNDAVISAKPNYATQLLGAQFLDEMARNGFDFGYEFVDLDGEYARSILVVFRDKAKKHFNEDYMHWWISYGKINLRNCSKNPQIVDIMRKHNLI